ncbi:MAG: nucleoside deaminase [Bacteroidales bacterium]|nr:nucleoside deaminase [Bacteroidales bacterium]
MILNDEYFMKEAIKEAKKAFNKDEVPVGSVIVYNNKIIARAHNMVESLNDVTAHAEIIAITAASNLLGIKYLRDCSIYVNLEPCPMCSSALNWAQIKNVIFGAYDPKNGSISKGYNLFHPKTKIKGGVLKNETEQLLKMFFENKRKKK